MNRPLARRDFVLDSGALSHLASDYHGAAAWIAHIDSAYERAAILLPYVVLAESLTGNPRRDANVHRLLKRLTPTRSPESMWLDATFPASSRAAALRTQAISSGATSAKRPISVIDALVVALAEERSVYNAVTILTSDRIDIQLLVDLTGATNIAVQAV